MRFEQYKVVITGADKAVGSAAAKLFMDEGASVIGVGKNFSQDADPRMIQYACDIAKADDIVKASEFISKTFGGTLDTFVSADGMPSVGTPDNFTDEEFDAVLNVVLRAPMLFARNLFPMLQKAEKNNPSIVNVSSSAAFSNEPHSVLYNIANTALVRFTKTAAIQFGVVRCNTVCPSIVNDNFLTNDGKFSEETAARVKNVLIEKSASKRLPEPEEIAEAIAFLASVDAEYTTGADILMDSGISVTAGVM